MEPAVDIERLQDKANGGKYQCEGYESHALIKSEALIDGCSALLIVEKETNRPKKTAVSSTMIAIAMIISRSPCYSNLDVRLHASYTAKLKKYLLMDAGFHLWRVYWLWF